MRYVHFLFSAFCKLPAIPFHDKLWEENYTYQNPASHVFTWASTHEPVGYLLNFWMVTLFLATLQILIAYRLSKDELQQKHLGQVNQPRLQSKSPGAGIITYLV